MNIPREIILTPNPKVQLDLDVEKCNFRTCRVTHVIEESSAHVILRYTEAGIDNSNADPIIIGSVMDGKNQHTIAIWRDQQRTRS